MKNSLVKWTAGFAIAFSQTVSAAPVTDTVIIGMQEWAQVDLFTNVSWNTLNTQCPSGVCSLASAVNGYDLAGWTWAPNQDVQDMFNTLTGRTDMAPAVFPEVGSAWAPAITALFRATRTTPSFEELLGWSSTKHTPANGYTPQFVNFIDVGQPDYTSTNLVTRVDVVAANFGGWFVRSAPKYPLLPH